MAEREARTKVKEVPNATLWSDGTISIYNVRASYPHVLTKYKGDDDDAKAKFSMVGLMPKKKSYRQARELIEGVIQKLLKENKVARLKPDNIFFRDGDLAAREEYEGMRSINASETKKVAVRHKIRDQKTGKPKVLVAGKDDDVIYAGCWVNMVIRPWFQNNKYGKKVNAGLVAVQFVNDDEPFGQGRISEEEVDKDFDDYAEDDGGDDESGDEDDEI